MTKEWGENPKTFELTRRSSGNPFSLRDPDGDGVDEGVGGGSVPAALEAYYTAWYPNYTDWGAADESNISTWYYVKTDGDDTADGLSWATAWQTIGKAWETIGAGEGAIIRAGTYSHPGDATLTAAGTATDPACIKCEDLNNRPVIDGQGTGNLYWGGNNSHVKIYGLEIANTAGRGMGQGAERAGPSSNMTVERCILRDIEGPQGQNIAAFRMDEVKKSVFRNCQVLRVNDVQGGSDGHAFESYDAENILFEYNRAENTAKGFFVKQPPNADLTGCIVRRNIFKDLRSKAWERGGSTGSPMYHHTSFFSENLCIRAGVADFCRETTQSKFLKLFNNTLIDAAIVSDGCESISGFNNIISWNNVGTDAIKWDYRDPATNSTMTLIEWDYNCYPTGFKIFVSGDAGYSNQNYTTLASWQAVTNDGVMLLLDNPDANGTTQDPLFTDTANDDYTLQAGSPMLSAGKDGLHIGAYAYDGATIGSDLA